MRRHLSPKHLWMESTHISRRKSRSTVCQVNGLVSALNSRVGTKPPRGSSDFSYKVALTKVRRAGPNAPGDVSAKEMRWIFPPIRFITLSVPSSFYSFIFLFLFFFIFNFFLIFFFLTFWFFKLLFVFYFWSSILYFLLSFFNFTFYFVFLFLYFFIFFTTF